MSKGHIEDADGSVPTPERQVELRRAYHANRAEGKPPYAGVRFYSRSELEWVVLEHGWRPNALPQESARINLTGVNLREINLNGIDLRKANLADATLWGTTITNACLTGANMAGANLARANLSGTDLRVADLTRVFMMDADLTAADLGAAVLSCACLQHTRMDADTILNHAQVDGARLIDVRWNGASLTHVKWGAIQQLGDEVLARQDKEDKDPGTRLRQFNLAAAASQQVATALRAQGLNEPADYFAYRAQVCQRTVLWHQRKVLPCAGSLLLDLISGYGYRPLRAFIAYALVILAFAGLYLLNAQFAAPHLTWDESLVLSVSSFHGRGFFSSDIHLGDTLARLAAGEAIIGLLIEITFIATFTQRFFAR